MDTGMRLGRPMQRGALFVVLLSGCGTTNPCTGVLTEYELLDLAGDTRIMQTQGVPAQKAAEYCWFVHEGVSEQEVACCWWIVDEFYGN